MKLPALPADLQKFIADADEQHAIDGHSWAPHPLDSTVEYCQFCGETRIGQDWET